MGRLRLDRGERGQAKALDRVAIRPGGRRAAIIPLLDLAQRQIGAETQTAGLAADPGDRIVAA